MQRFRIVFFGSGVYTIPIVEKLKNNGLTLVVTSEVEGELIRYLKKENVTFKSTNLKNGKDLELIKKQKPRLGILASYGAIVPKNVINLFPLGIFNIHPSLLPKYKGPSPIQATILNGEHETGVTIIRLDEQVDHGPIAAQEKVKLLGKETTEDLKEQLFAKGAEMISSIIQSIERGKELKLQEQDHSKESFTQKITRADGFIDIQSPPTKEKLDRMIRAYHPWPGVWTKFQVRSSKSEVIKFLPNQKIQVGGGKPMSYKDFINGYQQEGRQLLDKLGLAAFPASS